MTTDLEPYDVEATAAEHLDARRYLLLRLNARLQGRQLIPGLVAWAAHTNAQRNKSTTITGPDGKFDDTDEEFGFFEDELEAVSE